MSVAERTSGLSARPRLLPSIGLRGAGTVLLLAGICAIPIGLYAPFYNEPFMRDEGVYATFAQIIKHGGIPYRDAFDNKPPLIFAWYYLSFLLFGEHVWAPRLLVSLLLSGATLLMYMEGRLLFSHRYGVATAFLFAMSFGLATLETNANTEFFMIPALVAALLTFTLGQKTGRWQWYAAAGFMSGAAIATKDVSLFPYGLFLAIAAWPHPQARGVRAMLSPEFRGPIGGLLGGGILAFLLVIAPFAATGTLPDLYQSTVVFTVQYVGGVPLSTKLNSLLQLPPYLTFILGPWLVLSVLGVFHMRREGAGGWGPLLIGWPAANFIGIVAAGKFTDHYFITLLPGLSLIAPLGVIYISRHWRSLGQRRWLALTTTLVVVLPVLVVVQVSQNASIYFRSTAAARHIAKFSDDDRAPWENQGPDLGAWLAARTQPDDPIYNFGFQSELYFYADRRPPTRFLLDRFFRYSDSYTDEALSDLNANKPVYVVDSAIYESWAPQKVYNQRVKDWIVANYDYVGKIYYADVWQLKAVTA